MITAADDVQSFEGQAVAEEVFLAVLAEAIAAIEGQAVPYGVMGGIASAVLGRPRWTHDIDVFVPPDGARRVLAGLAEAGFATQETNPLWLFKGIKHGVLVDVLFKAKGEIYFDAEMAARTVAGAFKGQRLRLIPPEDLLVIKAIVHDEDTPRHWFDALGIVAACSLDWEYLVRRARHGARRVLGLLLYAQSVDLVVPDGAIEALFAEIYAAPDPAERGA